MFYLYKFLKKLNINLNDLLSKIKNISYFAIIMFLFIGCKSIEIEKNKKSFTVSNQVEEIPIYVDKNVDDLILWAVNELATDIKSVTGKKPEIIKTTTIGSGKGIYIGQSTDLLFKSTNSKDFFSSNWETFSIKNQKKYLTIIGSDVRGTVYGVFELSKQLGISPWQWWADVHPEKKEKLHVNLPENGIIQSPSVQYRGVFLNDEDWGLQPWAAKNFEPETGDIGPKTYEKIFQLLLRLKANTIWPAMHPSTKGFFTIEGNKDVAEKYHILIGTSHAEPMLRNNVDEWDKKVYGAYNYFTNNYKIKEYWKARIDEVKNGNGIFTLGMRGIHDSGMEGNASKEEKKEILETIIKDQRKILSNTIQKPIIDIPQVFIPYKEVLDVYNDGLSVPEDITLMWTDDNYGYIRRYSTKEEQIRNGGGGVYYHLSYWGRPHDYLWLSSTQPGLIWYEMTRAYQNGAKKMWIANVGDIKPLEYNMEFFLDLAWDINSIKENTIKDHLKKWASREFGNQISDDLSIIMNEYYRLALIRKPEFMGWG